MKWKKADTALVKNSLKIKSAFFDCFYVMPPLKKGGALHCCPETGVHELIRGADEWNGKRGNSAFRSRSE